MSTTEATTTLKSLELLLTTQGPQLAKQAPRRLEELKGVLRELKGSPKGKLSAAAQQTVRDLFTWQLDLKRQAYQAQAAALKAAAARKEPAAVTALRAVEDVLKVLDEAKLAMAAPSVAAANKVDAAATRARGSLGKVSPPAAATKAPAPMQAFRVRPGSSVAAPPTGAKGARKK